MAQAESPGAAPGQLLIGSISVEGLVSISEKEFLYLLDMTSGKPFNKENLTRGVKRAFLKGIFDDIVIEQKNRNEAGINISVKVVEKKVIDTISIDGNEHFSKRFIKKRLGIEEGDRLNFHALNAGIKKIQTEFSSRGFPRSKISYALKLLKGIKTELIITIHEDLPELIQEIVVTGQDTVVRSYLTLNKGDIYNQTVLQKIIEKTEGAYKKGGYIGHRITYEYSGGILTISADQGKKVVVSVSGNAAINEKTIRKEMVFFEINEFNQDLVDESVSRVAALYRKNGYTSAQIVPLITASDDETILHLYISEGERKTVAAIDFDGISISADRLRAMLAMRPGHPYDPALIASDRDIIAEFYRALGYINAEVNDPAISYDAETASLTYKVSEGHQVKIGDILIKDGGRLQKDLLLSSMPLKKNDPYNEIDILDARRKLIELYQKHGFLNIRVKIQKDIKSFSADIVFIVDEGDITRFGKHVVIGNERTRFKVIARELVHADGALYNPALLYDERLRLSMLGLFSAIDIGASERYDEKRDVYYTLKEAAAGAFEFGLGYGEYERYRGFFDISYRNFGGMNRRVSLRTELSTIEQRVILSFSEPRFLDKDIDFAAFLLHENKKELNYDSGNTLYRLTRETATVGIEKKLSPRFKGEFFYELSLVNTSDVQPDVILSKEDTGHLLISAIRPGIVYDTRDNPFDPREGVLAGISLKVASIALLSQTDFIKLFGYLNTYRHLAKRFVLAVSLRGGFAKGFRDTSDLPLIERFFLGGRTTVRGYAQDSLGPKGADGNPTGGNTFAMGSVEIRTDLGRGFGIVTFLDAGNVWQNLAMNLAQTRFTTGLGLRYKTPVGPLRIDYGRKLSRREGESHGELHFSIGQAF